MGAMRAKKGDELVPAQPFRDFLEQRRQFHIRDLGGEEASESTTTTERLGPLARVALEIGFMPGDKLDRRQVEAGLRRLYRYRNGLADTAKVRNGKKERFVRAVSEFPRSVVEDALHKVDPYLFGELYPEHVRLVDVTVEPDAWCPFCRTCAEHDQGCPNNCGNEPLSVGRFVTPVDGLCPFCQCEHGHLFREVGVTDDGFACLACLKKEAAEKAHVDRRKTHCKQGHEYTEENTYHRADGWRMCKTCTAEHGRNYRARRKKAA